MVPEETWEFLQPVCMCSVDLEKAFDHVGDSCGGCSGSKGVTDCCIQAISPLYTWSHSLVCISSSKSNSRIVRFGLHQGFHRILLRLSRIRPLHFADDMALFASSGHDPSTLTRLVHIRVWSSWDDYQHVQVPDHGSQSEKSGVPSLGGGCCRPLPRSSYPHMLWLTPVVAFDLGLWSLGDQRSKPPKSRTSPKHDNLFLLLLTFS